MLVSVDSLPEYYGDIVRDELNIKQVELGSDLSKYVNFEIKPNLPVLGKAYGKMIPGIRKGIASMNQMDLAQRVNNGEVVTINVDGTEIELNKENLLVTMQGLEGFAFAGEGEIGVVLDTNISEELREEGHIREVLSKIQNMRKETGFEVSDKINLYFAGNEALENVIRKFENQIKKDTLALTVAYDSDKAINEVKINGEKLLLHVERV